jgi:hypothetical protein
MYILDQIMGWLTDRIDFDDQIISSPGGVQIRERSRQGVREQDGYVKWYIYGLTVSVEQVYQMTDVRTYVDLLEFVVDVVKPDPAGDFPIIGDGSPGPPGMEIDN